MQIGVLEDTRNRTLHGILRVQSCFRGHQARCYLKELRRGISILQSCISLLQLYFVEIFHTLLRRNFLQELILLHPLMQLFGQKKLERNMQSYCRDIELLL